MVRESLRARRPKPVAEALRAGSGFPGPGGRPEHAEALLLRLLPGLGCPAFSREAEAGARGREGAKLLAKERGEQTRRGRGKRAPSVCCRGAAGARRGGMLLTTWTLFTCGQFRPERSRVLDPPGTPSLSQLTLTTDLCFLAPPPPIAICQPFQLGVRRWRGLLSILVRGPTR